MIEKYESDTVRADKFIELVKRYTDFSELTTPMLNEFVEKIHSLGKNVRLEDLRCRN